MKKLLVVLIVSALALVACASVAATATPAAPSPRAAATTAPSQAPAETPTPPATATEPPPSDTPPSSAATATAEPGGTEPAGYVFTPVARGFQSPVLVTHAGDGTGRLFVVEQGGTIRVVQNGAVLPVPFINLTDQVTHGGSEEGLLGLAFDPHYAQSGQFYVYFTDPDGNTHVVRYHVSAADPNQADAASAQDLLQVQQPPYPNHKGGNIVFGPDGYLYVSLGDGGSQGDPHGNGQNRNTLLGKILRLDVSGGGNKYSIPPSNPFVGQSGARGEIWAYGLRNPWRATFDRATGDFWIGDVGQNTYEEIDFQPAGDKGGENYGWNYMEGNHPYRGQPPAGLTLVPPAAEYTHDEGGCSVTGGYAYRGPSLPALSGVYFFGDYCTGFTWTLARTRAGDQWQRAPFISSGLRISSFGEDEAGELYVCDYSAGVIYRLARAQ